MAGGGYATVILSPHQDDEIIRLAGYIEHMSDRGDSLALVQATDGSATYVGRKLGLSPAGTANARYREQAHSWSWLTNGRGDGNIHRLGLPDGGGMALVDDIYAGVWSALQGLAGSPEVYVATMPPDHRWATMHDQHPDHAACAAAAARLEGDGVTVRYALHPTSGGRGVVYDNDAGQVLRLEAAVAAYTYIGQRSTPDSFQALLDTNGRSRVTWA